MDSDNFSNLNYSDISYSDISQAYARIKDHISHTALIENQEINQELGARVFLKMENQQITNSFKVRGAFNAILSYQEKHGHYPKKIVVQSSGNHAQAVALVANQFNIELVAYMASNVSDFKIQKVKDLGAKIIICNQRREANKLAEKKREEGYFFIHPSDNDDVILGQATCAFEIFKEIDDLAALFIPCGGGGLVAGCYLAAQGLSQKTKIFACEPIEANDSAISLRQNSIFSFSESPNTIADGARTLAISQRCFSYLKQIAGILEIKEERISYWQQSMSNILGQAIEPTAALSIAGLEKYIQQNNTNPHNKFGAIITGGNI